MGVPQNGWFIYFMENPMKMDDLGVRVPLFQQTSTYFCSTSTLFKSQVKVKKRCVSMRGSSSYKMYDAFCGTYQKEL